jgi:tetratricopeptide (TPR) repeat protein
MYCGTAIEVKQAIQASAGVNIDNYFRIAEKADEALNYPESYKYYTKVLEYDPDNTKAWFGKARAAGRCSTLADFRITEMITGFQQAVEFTPDADRVNVKRAANREICSICNDFYTLAKNHLLDYVALNKSWGDFLSHSKLLLFGLEKAHELDPSDRVTMENIIFLCADNIRGVKFNDPYQNNASRVWFLSDAYEAELRKKMSKYAFKLKKIDPSYKLPEAKRQTPSACFIATATLGDYNHPDVRILRSFRDEILQPSSLGQLFVKWYYRYSPRLAERIARHNWLKSVSYQLLIKPLASLSRRLLN